MNTITWSSSNYKINHQSQFLISGECHYFRIPQSQWRWRLERLKEAGGNCVATYIPWVIHEPQEGTFLFSDVPERDLEGFLKLCKEMDLFVICRPGPYQYSEMRYDGLPEWLCENYPEIHAINVEGKKIRKASVSYLHPLFLEKVHKWYSKVCPIIARYTVSRGGPIAFVQFDNEMMGVHYWYGGGWDYNKTAMGIGVQDGRYPLFLQNRYRDVKNMNRSYDTDFESFEAVSPYQRTKPSKKEDRIRIKDYQDFYFHAVAEYAELLTHWMKAWGIDCDFVHNAPNPASNSQFLETVRRLGDGFLLGSDHYYTLGPGWEQNNPTPQYASKVFFSNEMLRLMGYPPTIFELPGGSSCDWPPVTPEDFQCCYYTNLAFGMKGFNYFIFTGGPNPFQCGMVSDLYDYGAAISAGGTIRPLYAIQKDFGAFLTRYRWLSSSHMVCDCYIGLDWEQSRSSSYFYKAGEYGMSNYNAWEFLTNGLLITALCSSYSPEMIDLDSLKIAKINKPLLIATSVCMAANKQRNIIEYVERGGRVLLCPVIPYLDENFNSCTLLKEFLDNPEVQPCPQYAPRLRIGNIDNVFVNEKLFICSKQPEEAVSISHEVFSDAETGWKSTFAGGGKVIWLGLQWTYCMNEHSAMFRFLLHELGVKDTEIKCSNKNIWAVLRKYNSKAMLFIMNLYSAPMRAEVRIKQSNGQYLDTGVHELKPMEVKTMEVDLYFHNE